MEFDAHTIETFSAYAFILTTIVITLFFYAYIYHIYNNEKKGIKDYEKYSQIVLDDEITSTPVEKLTAKEKWELEKKKNKGDKA